jgi:hypothetical protein
LSDEQAGGERPAEEARQEGAPRGGRFEPTDEELRAALEEQMRRLRVEDVLVQTAVTLVNLAGRRLGLPGPEGKPEEGRDLAQAQLAIDATRALLPLLPSEPQGPVREALSQLQIAFARESQPSAGETPAAAGAEGAETKAEEAERAKARSKIWTPPGTA